MKELRKRLEEAESLGEIFKVVKKAVQEVLGVRRAGLQLALTDLPDKVKALHKLGTNLIIMNKKTVSSLLSSRKPRLEVNAYIFSILLHEYIKSFGVLDDEEVRALSLKVLRETLGEDEAYEMAFREIAEYPPELGEEELNYRLDGKFELVEDFDLDNTHYIG
ncbi:MAG: hypothetical protein J7J94_02385 [Thaumarchaeota archaeon]|nr:hypothetical protein [Nitrososphaerota archaeon]